MRARSSCGVGRATRAFLDRGAAHRARSGACLGARASTARSGRRRPRPPRTHGIALDPAPAGVTIGARRARRRLPATRRRDPESRDDEHYHERPRYVPVSTYRLQVHGGFPLTAARDVVRLPGTARRRSGLHVAVLRRGSGQHARLRRLQPQRDQPGAGRRRRACAVRRRHRGARPPAHRRLRAQSHGHRRRAPTRGGRDVLENGPSSPAAKFFDIDWTPVKAELHAKLLLPILGDQYGQVLERGELQLTFRDGALVLRYFDNELPVNPRQAPRVYRLRRRAADETLGPDNPQLHEFLSIIASLENMPPYTDHGSASAIAERQREKEVARDRLARLVSEAPIVGEHIETEVVSASTASPGSPRASTRCTSCSKSQAVPAVVLAHGVARDQLPPLLRRQHARRPARRGRRACSTQTHRAARAADRRRQGAGRSHRPSRTACSIPRATSRCCRISRRVVGHRARGDRDGRPDRPLYVLAEKILSGREALPRRWAVHGTTGYNFLNDLNGIFVDIGQARQPPARLRQAHRPLRAVRRRAVSQQAADHRDGDGERADRAHRTCSTGSREGSRQVARLHAATACATSIVEVVACFPVYRTYVDEDGWTPEDRAVVERAIARARRRNPAMEASLFDFFREVMLPRDVGQRSAAERPPRRLSAGRRRRRPASGCASR